MYFSQYKQDKFLNEVIFSNKKVGFFIDIGAYDGVTISNSLFFERFKNWEGICIEPNPAVYNKLITNRKSINLNVCVGNENKNVRFTQIEGYSEMLSGVTEKYDERHIQRINNDILLKGGSRTDIEVEMITLSSIDGIKDKIIDFISIDTEGNEYDIIKSIDFKFCEIKSLVIENNYKDHKIKEYLHLFGFELIHKLECDEIFINKKHFSVGIKRRLFFWKTKLLLKRIGKKIGIKI